MPIRTVTTPPAAVGAAPQVPVVAVRAEAAVKVYGRGEAAVRALDDVSVGIPAGRFTAIMGPSGSGKSTLMHCLAGLDDLTSGRCFVGDVELGSLSDHELTCLRREYVGFVFQSFNLLPVLTAAENITIVMVTHDPLGAAHADAVVFLADGRIVEDMTEPTAERVLERMKSLGS